MSTHQDTAEPIPFDYTALPANVHPYRRALRETEQLSVELRAEHTAPEHLYSSRVGGWPYLLTPQQYPLAADGAPMAFIAQINFGDLPSLPGYPDSGILQFFADDRTNQAAVVYHQDYPTDWKPPATAIPQSGMQPWGLTDPAALYALTGRLHQLPASGGYSAAAWAAFEQTSESGDFNTDTDFDYYCDAFENRGHRIGGHPYFTQSTFATVEDEDTVLLLQIDSDPWAPSDDYRILFGDLGTARFFIPRSALAARNFEAVQFNWDNA